MIRFSFLIFSALMIAARFSSAAIFTYDQDGFVSCLRSSEKTYFFFRDPFTKADGQTFKFISQEDYIQQARHFVKGCKDVKFLREVPGEYLKDVQDHASLFPELVKENARQLEIGGRVYRQEKTPQEFYQNHLELFRPNQSDKIQTLKSLYGSQFVSSLVTLWLQERKIQYGDDCHQLIGSCDFYLCQETKNPCGLQGYNLGYGFKYCSASKFDLLLQMTTAHGKSWVQNVFTCLQEQSLKQDLTFLDLGVRCEAIKSSAMKAHPGCYVGSGFCDLKVSEKVKIFNTIKDEIFSAQTVVQGHEVLKRCEFSKDLKGGVSL